MQNKKVFIGDFYTSKYGFSMKITEKNLEKVREKLTEALEGLEVGGYLNLNEIAPERREETASKFGRDIDQTASHVLVSSPGTGEVTKASFTPPAAAANKARVRKFD